MGRNSVEATKAIFSLAVFADDLTEDLTEALDFDPAVLDELANPEDLAVLVARPAVDLDPPFAPEVCVLPACALVLFAVVLA